jgi:aerobic-type carbon monoxide dehydrogenase small subunit (CoxS/CutS family)
VNASAEKHLVTLLVNGETHVVAVAPWRTLDQVLREDLRLTRHQAGLRRW